MIIIVETVNLFIDKYVLVGWDIRLQQVATIDLCILLQTVLVPMCPFPFNLDVIILRQVVLGLPGDVDLRDMLGILFWGVLITCPSCPILLCLIASAMLFHTSQVLVFVADLILPEDAIYFGQVSYCHHLASVLVCQNTSTLHDQLEPHLV